MVEELYYFEEDLYVQITNKDIKEVLYDLEYVLYQEESIKIPKRIYIINQENSLYLYYNESYLKALNAKLEDLYYIALAFNIVIDLDADGLFLKEVLAM